MEQSRYHPRPLCGDSVGPSKCASEGAAEDAAKVAAKVAAEVAAEPKPKLVVLAIFENLPVGRSGPYFRVL